MIKCLVCAGEDFYNAHGLYFCKTCDTQTFDFFEQADIGVHDNVVEESATRFAVPVTGSRITNQARSQTQSQLLRPDDDEGEAIDSTLVAQKPSKDGRPFTTFEMFQTILSAQVNSLIQIGFPQTLRARVFKIWCLYLSEIKEAFCGQRNDIIYVQRVTPRDASRITANSRTFVGNRKRVNQEDGAKTIPLSKEAEVLSGSRLAATKLNLNSLLCILYLGIKVTNPIYTISDIIRWIKDGTLPYFNADRVLPEDMKMVNDDHRSFTHLVLPNHTKLRTQTANIARYLNFTAADFQPVPIELLCVRYTCMLNLPGELVSPTLNFLSTKRPHLKFTPTNPDPRMKGVPSYEAVAASYIIITLRDLFGFTDKLDCHLSTYATAIQSQLSGGKERLFNVSKWMDHMISEVKVRDLPQHNRDTQRLSCLRSALDSYKSIAPPSSRFAARGAIAMPINKISTRKQLESSLEQLSVGVRECKSQRQRQRSLSPELCLDEDELNLDGLWSQPEVTSTQLPSSTTSASISTSDDFRTHSIAYVMDHRLFSDRHELIESYDDDSLLAHVQQWFDDAKMAAQVTRSLVSGGNYRSVSNEQMSQCASLQALFEIFADHLCLPLKDLVDVYNVIEEAYIRQQNGLPVDSFTSAQFIFFPRTRSNVKKKSATKRSH